MRLRVTSARHLRFNVLFGSDQRRKATGMLRPSTVLISLHKNRKSWFTNGDLVSGDLILTAPSRINVTAIEISLRCEEVAEVMYTHGAGSGIDIQKNRSVELKQRLFPDHDQDFSSTGEYSIQRGEHIFPFAFQIPDDIHTGTLCLLMDRSGVNWYIKGVVRRAERAVPDLRTIRAILMQPSIEKDPPGTGLPAFRSVIQQLEFNTFSASRPRGIKGLLADRDYRELTRVSLKLRVPSKGVQQSPNEIGVQLLLDADRPDLVIWCGLKLIIEQTTEISTNQHSSGSRERILLASYTGFEVDLSDSSEVQSISSRLEGEIIRSFLTPNFESSVFKHSYEMVAEATIAAKYKPWKRELIRAKIPVKVLSRSLSILVPEAEYIRTPSTTPPPMEVLPEYTA